MDDFQTQLLSQNIMGGDGAAQTSAHGKDLSPFQQELLGLAAGKDAASAPPPAAPRAPLPINAEDEVTISGALDWMEQSRLLQQERAKQEAESAPSRLSMNSLTAAAKLAAPVIPGMWPAALARGEGETPSWGALTPEEATRETQASLDARRQDLAAAEATNATPWWRPALEPLAGPYTPAERERNISSLRAGISEAEAKLAGKAPLPTLTPARSFLETIPKTFAESYAAVPRFAGVVAGWASERGVLQGLAGGTGIPLSGREMPGAPFEAVTKIGDNIDAWAKHTWPGDKARQDEFGTKTASFIGFMASLYGAGAIKSVASGGPVAIAEIGNVITKVSQASLAAAPSAMSHYDAATEVMRQQAVPGTVTDESARVTERDRRLATLMGAGIGLTSLIPLASAMATPAERGAGEIMAQALKGSGITGAQMAAFNVMSNTTARLTYDPSRNPVEGLGEDVALGMMFGGASHGFMAATGKPAPGEDAFPGRRGNAGVKDMGMTRREANEALPSPEMIRTADLNAQMKEMVSAAQKEDPNRSDPGSKVYYSNLNKIIDEKFPVEAPPAGKAGTAPAEKPQEAAKPETAAQAPVAPETEGPASPLLKAADQASFNEAVTGLKGKNLTIGEWREIAQDYASKSGAPLLTIKSAASGATVLRKMHAQMLKDRGEKETLQRLAGEDISPSPEAAAAAAYPGREIIAAGMASPDSAVKGVAQAIASAAPGVATLKAGISLGEVAPEADSTDSMPAALKILMEIQKNGSTPDTYFAGRAEDATVEAIVRGLHGKADAGLQAENLIRSYVQGAIKHEEGGNIRSTPEAVQAIRTSAAEKIAEQRRGEGSTSEEAQESIQAGESVQGEAGSGTSVARDARGQPAASAGGRNTSAAGVSPGAASMGAGAQVYGGEVRQSGYAGRSRGPTGRGAVTEAEATANVMRLRASTEMEAEKFPDTLKLAVRSTSLHLSAFKKAMSKGDAGEADDHLTEASNGLKALRKSAQEAQRLSGEKYVAAVDPLILAVKTLAAIREVGPREYWDEIAQTPGLSVKDIQEEFDSALSRARGERVTAEATLAKLEGDLGLSRASTQSMIDAAVKDGRLRIGNDGKVRWNVQDESRAASPPPRSPIIPPAERLSGMISAYERANNTTLTPNIRAAALSLETAMGNASIFPAAMAEAEKGVRKLKEWRDLAGVLGTRQITSKDSIPNIKDAIRERNRAVIKARQMAAVRDGGRFYALRGRSEGNPFDALANRLSEDLGRMGIQTDPVRVKIAVESRIEQAYGIFTADVGKLVKNSKSADVARRAARLQAEIQQLMDVLGFPARAFGNAGRLSVVSRTKLGQDDGQYAPGLSTDARYSEIRVRDERSVTTIAHEWFHHLDNYFGGFNASPERTKRIAFMSERRGKGPRVSEKYPVLTEMHAMEHPGTGARPEVQQAWDHLYKTVFKGSSEAAQIISDYDRIISKLQLEHEIAANLVEREPANEYAIAGAETALERIAAAQAERSFAEIEIRKGRKGAFAIKAAIEDKASGSTYWSDPAELVARAFESYFRSKLGIAEDKNTLFRIPDADKPAVYEAFDDLFSTLKLRDTPQGPEFYALRGVHSTNFDFSKVDEMELGKRDAGYWGRGLYMYPYEYATSYGNLFYGVPIEGARNLIISVDAKNIFHIDASNWDNFEGGRGTHADYDRLKPFGYEYGKAPVEVWNDVSRGYLEAPVDTRAEALVEKRQNAYIAELEKNGSHGQRAKELLEKLKAAERAARPDHIIAKKFTDALLKAGYDAVVTSKNGEPFEMVAIKPNTVKSTFGGIPMYALGQAYAFAGTRALTADHGGLSAAKNMEVNKQSPQDIWKDTGWYKGVDGLWRFELDDSSAKIKIKIPTGDEATDGDQFDWSGTLEDFIDHKNLFESYPNLRKFKVSIGLGSYYYGSSSGVGNGELLLRPHKGESTLSVALHEIQHLIQESEGFDRGSAPSIIQKNNEILINDIDREIESLTELGLGHNVIPALKVAREALVKSWLYMSSSWMSTSDAAHSAYTRISGEVEARNTQYRRGMTAEARRQLFPDTTQDVLRQDMLRPDAGIIAEVNPEFEAAVRRVVRDHTETKPEGMLSRHDSLRDMDTGYSYAVNSLLDDNAQHWFEVYDSRVRERASDISRATRELAVQNGIPDPRTPSWFFGKRKRLPKKDVSIFEKTIARDKKYLEEAVYIRDFWAKMIESGLSVLPPVLLRQVRVGGAISRSGVSATPRVMPMSDAELEAARQRKSKAEERETELRNKLQDEVAILLPKWMNATDVAYASRYIVDEAVRGTSVEQYKINISESNYDSSEIYSKLIKSSNKRYLTDIRSAILERQHAYSSRVNMLFTDAEPQSKLTPEFQAAWPDIADQIVSEIQEMVPEGVRVIRGLQGLSESGLDIEGHTDVARKLIRLALSDGDVLRGRAVGRHEVLAHLMRGVGAYTEAEWGKLVERARKIGAPSRITDASGNDLVPEYRRIYTRQAEAAVRAGRLDPADVPEYVEESLNQEYVGKMAEEFEQGSKFGATIDKLLARMRQILDAIWRALRDAGFVSKDRVFSSAQDIMSETFSGARARRMEQAAARAEIETAPGGRIEPAFDIKPDEAYLKGLANAPILPGEASGLRIASRGLGRVSTGGNGEIRPGSAGNTGFALGRARVSTSGARLVDGYRGFVTRRGPDSRGLGRRSYYLYPEGAGDVAENAVPSSVLGEPLGYLHAIEADPGVWVAGDVSLKAGGQDLRGQGTGAKLYDAAETDLRTKLQPSGILLDNGYRFWLKRDPKAVEFYQQLPFEKDGTFYSPLRLLDMLHEFDDLRARSGNIRDLAKFEEQQKLTQQAFDSLPEDIRTETLRKFAGSLGGNFAIGGGKKKTPDIKPLAEQVENLRQALGITMTKGLWRMTVRGISSGRSMYTRPGPNVQSQYDVTGDGTVMRYRTTKLLDEIAAQGGKHLEARYGQDMQDFLDAHKSELEPMGGGVTFQSPVSNGFSAFFKQYLIDPKLAQRLAPRTYADLGDFLDAHDPGLAGRIESAQILMSQKDYQNYLAATNLDRARADLATTITSKTKKGGVVQALTALGKHETLTGFASTLYTNFLDQSHPQRELVSALLRQADANGVVDADGRPISLKYTEDPAAMVRAHQEAFKVGLMHLMNGVPNWMYSDAGWQVFGKDGRLLQTFTIYKDAEEFAKANGISKKEIKAAKEFRSPSLFDAMKTFSGANGKWDTKSTIDFGCYLESRRAVVEWQRYEDRLLRLQALQRGIDATKRFLSGTPASALAAKTLGAREQLSKIESKIERRRLAIAQQRKLVQEYERDLIAALKWEATAVSEGITTGLERQKEGRSVQFRNDTRFRSLEAGKDLDTARQRLQDLDAEMRALAGTYNPLTGKVDGGELQQVMASIKNAEDALNHLRALRKKEQDAGLQREPHQKTKDVHEDVISKTEAEYPQARAAAELVYGFLRQSAIYTFQSGLITKEQLDHYLSRSHFYVPWWRDLSDKVALGRAGLGSTSPARPPRWDASKQTVGSNAPVINPLEAIIEMHQFRVAQADFNRIVAAYANLAEQAGPGASDILEVLPARKLISNDPDGFDVIRDMLVKEGHDSADAYEMASRIAADYADMSLMVEWKPAQNAVANLKIPFLKNGERIYLQINDPEWAAKMHQSFMGMGREMTNTVIEAMGKFSLILSGPIWANPAFSSVHAFRTVGAAAVLAGDPLRPMTYPGVAQAVGFRHLMGRTDVYSHYHEAGGTMGVNAQHLSRTRDRLNIVELQHAGYRVSSKLLAAGVSGGALLGGAAAHFAGAGTVAGAVTGAYFGGVSHRGRILDDMAGLSDAMEMATRLGYFPELTKVACENNPYLTPAEAYQEAAYMARGIFDPTPRGARMYALLKTVAFGAAHINHVNQSLQKVVASHQRGVGLSPLKMLAGMGAMGAAGTIVGGPIGMWAGAFAVPAGMAWAAKRSSKARKAFAPFGQKPKSERISRDQEIGYGIAAKFWSMLLATTAFYAICDILQSGDPEYDAIDAAFKSRWQPIKLFGQWGGFPRSFQLGIPAATLQAVMDAKYKKDPRMLKRIEESVYESIIPPLMPQAINLYMGVSSGKDSFSGRDITPYRMKGLDPQRQFDANTSKLAILLSRAINSNDTVRHVVEGVGGTVFRNKEFQLSPFLIDWSTKSLFGYFGKDALNASDLVLSPNSPAAQRIAAFPVLGTLVNRWSINPYEHHDAMRLFWDKAGKSSSPFQRASKQYSEYLSIGTGKPGVHTDMTGDEARAAANAFLASRPVDERVYALVQNEASGYERSLHPINRLRTIVSVVNQMNTDMLQGGLSDTSAKKGSVPIPVSPDRFLQAKDLLTQYAASEAQNTFVAMRAEQFASYRRPLDAEGVLKALKESEPAIYNELQVRLHRHAQMGRGRFFDWKVIEQQWPMLEKRLLDNWQRSMETNRPMPGARMTPYRARQQAGQMPAEGMLEGAAP